MASRKTYLYKTQKKKIHLKFSINATPYNVANFLHNIWPTTHINFLYVCFIIDLNSGEYNFFPINTECDTMSFTH